MRTFTRYGLIGLLIIIGLFYLNLKNGKRKASTALDISFWTDDASPVLSQEYRDDTCDMFKCFNFSKCLGNFKKIYVLPNEDGQIISPAYKKILSALKESALYTNNPDEACLFVLSIDTTDRDRISENYVSDLDLLIKKLPANLWNEGSNFIVFNLYHGTFPDYSDHNLGFKTGKAMIARASPSVQSFRYGFDVSFPLFHAVHDLRSNVERNIDFEPLDQLLVSFKGKRYVYGIGSETRDALHHLHNGETIAMVTTCKHNNDWKEHQDSRCEMDNKEYEKWDYVSTMTNSTFCLTPRGRRLGSFRFLEALRIGCIPVVLSDDWVLPFAEVIDWTEAALVIAEENVLLVTDLLYSIPPERVIAMKQMCHYLYNRYFRDVESIALTTIQIILDRVRLAQRELSFAQSSSLSTHQETVFTTLAIKAAPRSSRKLQHLVNIFSQTMKITNIFIIWPEIRGVPPHGADFGTTLIPKFITNLEIDQTLKGKNITKTQVIYVDELLDLKSNDLEKLKYYMENFPNRLVGFHGLDVNMERQELLLSTKFNALFPSLIAFHGIYAEYIRATVPNEFISNCFGPSINVVLSEKTLKPPIVIKGMKQEDWMQIRPEAECWKRATERWVKPPIFYSDLQYE